MTIRLVKEGDYLLSECGRLHLPLGAAPKRIDVLLLPSLPLRLDGFDREDLMRCVELSRARGSKFDWVGGVIVPSLGYKYSPEEVVLKMTIPDRLPVAFRCERIGNDLWEERDTEFQVIDGVVTGSYVW